ncbi:SH3 domain-containing protein [Fulvivirga sediminis]|uniref:SH3 domain-containing protein n=1 Tax=Fulvivirga sediminis TaxID=2803949 RepID=A0A937K3E5_9BACT|nr:SH3 domain-containing protein [Fulvivirga sediminis]MBL3658887.1 hypothetical protein [Fulvivirga sediminis]
MKTLFFVIGLVVLSCGASSEVSEGSSETNVIKVCAKLHLQEIQGLWESYSYYLEHEGQKKDDHNNKYFKVIYENKFIDIIIKDSDSIILTKGAIGFSDTRPVNLSSFNDFQETGEFLIRKYEPFQMQQGSKIDTVNISKRHLVYFDTFEVLDDDLYYGANINDLNSLEKVSFAKSYSFPGEIFSFLKTKSKVGDVDYIKTFNIYNYSTKARVVSVKTYFHDEPSEDTKRRAYLLKGDIAYLEDEGGEWCKVYYDGKSSVTTGYVKRSDVEVIYPTQE